MSTKDDVSQLVCSNFRRFTVRCMDESQQVEIEAGSMASVFKRALPDFAYPTVFQLIKENKEILDVYDECISFVFQKDFEWGEKEILIIELKEWNNFAKEKSEGQAVLVLDLSEDESAFKLFQEIERAYKEDKKHDYETEEKEGSLVSSKKK